MMWCALIGILNTTTHVVKVISTRSHSEVNNCHPFFRAAVLEEGGLKLAYNALTDMALYQGLVCGMIPLPRNTDRQREMVAPRPVPLHQNEPPPPRPPPLGAPPHNSIPIGFVSGQVRPSQRQEREVMVVPQMPRQNRQDEPRPLGAAAQVVDISRVEEVTDGRPIPFVWPHPEDIT